MSEAVAQAITNKNNLVVEGGTGIGKSMAYLVPAILSIAEDHSRVVVATSHKALQDQLAKKDLPLLARLFAEQGYGPFTWAVLKGLNNYVCWHSVDTEQSRIMLDQTATKVVQFATKAGSRFSGDFEDVPFNVPPDSRSLLSADSEDCLGNKCPHRDRCYALAIRRKAEEADLVVTNHTLLSLEIRNEGVLPGDYNTFIVDEGHNFEDNATKANGLQVTLSQARRFINSDLVRRATAVSTGKLETARHNLERLQLELANLWTERATLNNGSGKFADNEDENRVLLKRELVAGRELADAIDDLAELLRHSKQKTIEEDLRATRVVKQGQAIAERLKQISLMHDPNLVYYAERNSYTLNPGGASSRFSQPTTITLYSIYGMPIDVSGYLAKWFNENNVIVTSATLSDGENFNFFMRRVGLSFKRTATLIVPSPFNYKDRIKLYLPRNNYQSSNGGGSNFFNNLAAQIAELISTVDGRILVLFTSHMAMEAVWRRLSGENTLLESSRPMFKQGEAQMQRIIADFQASENGIIFGTRSWWQGVDLPGMDMVIMDKLPFPQMNDPVVKARIETIDGDGGNSFVNFTLPLAIITFRQGFGRLMRKETDKGVVVVCDDRIVRQRYGQRFIKSLPQVGFLRNLNEVRDFIEEDE